MKKIYIVVIGTLCATAWAEITEKKTARSLYTMQPLFSLGSRIAGWKSALFSKTPTTGIRVTGGVTHSYKSSEMAQYFLFNHQESLVVRGSAHADYAANTTNIQAEWLKLPNNFEGTLAVKPSYRSWGIMITGKQSLQELCDWSFLQRCSLFIELPIVHNETNLSFTQSNVSNAGTNTDPVYDIVTAFNNPDWKYQRISTKPLKKTELAEIRLGLSNTFLSSDRALVALVSAVSIPVAKKYENNYMFEAQTGNNGHLGIISSVHMALPLSDEHAETHFSLFLDAEHLFLIRNHQYRTFDLKNNPWSRFLKLRLKDQQTDVTIPAMNVLTRKVRFSPYSQFDVLVGGKITGTYATFELAFGAWGQYQGRIKFTDTWQEIYGIAGDAATKSASASTIRKQEGNDTNFTSITEADFDIDSALSPAKAIYKTHAALTIHPAGPNHAAFATVGWQMQIPGNKTNGFTTWTLWGTIGGNF